MKRAYMDHAAATPVRPEVMESMLPFFVERFGNPLGRQGRPRIVGPVPPEPYCTLGTRNSSCSTRSAPARASFISPVVTTTLDAVSDKDRCRRSPVTMISCKVASADACARLLLRARPVAAARKHSRPITGRTGCFALGRNNTWELTSRKVPLPCGAGPSAQCPAILKPAQSALLVPEFPAVQQQIQRWNDDQRQHRGRHHAADHRRRDAPHDCCARA